MMTDQENDESYANLYLSKSELSLYNKIHADILNTKNYEVQEALRNNAFNLVNNAIYKKWRKK
jgi:hypothetical protein